MFHALPDITISHRNFSVTIPSFDVHEGEIVGLFGKSGAGKTSYLKRVRELFDPQDVHYMSQFDGLLEEITVRQNIELGLAATGMFDAKSWEWETQFSALLRDFEVDRHLAKYPRALSGGQRKRAEIVRCFIMNPKVLLLDEPFNGIGHLFEAICTREILHRRKESKGITLVVSHDFDLLSTFCNRILLLDDLGVIGFVPVHEAGWHPTDVRTAWTLAVDTVLPAATVRLLIQKGLPFLQENQWLGFWGRSAHWGQQGPTTIDIFRKDIVNIRHSLKQGMTYTHIEVALPTQEQPLVLVGQGTIPKNEETVILAIDEAWALNA